MKEGLLLMEVTFLSLVPRPMHGIADSFSGGQVAAVQSRPLAPRSGAELHKPIGAEASGLDPQRHSGLISANYAKCISDAVYGRGTSRTALRA